MKAHLDEGEVRHHRLDLLDDLGLRTCVERLELYVENHLFLWLGRSGRIFARGGVVCACASRCCCCSCGDGCCGQRDFLDVQTSLCVDYYCYYYYQVVGIRFGSWALDGRDLLFASYVPLRERRGLRLGGGSGRRCHLRFCAGSGRRRGVRTKTRMLSLLSLGGMGVVEVEVVLLVMTLRTSSSSRAHARERIWSCYAHARRRRNKIARVRNKTCKRNATHSSHWLRSKE